MPKIKNVTKPQAAQSSPELVAFKCRKTGGGGQCPSMQANMIILKPGMVRYTCVECRNVVTVTQGGGLGDYLN